MHHALYPLLFNRFYTFLLQIFQRSLQQISWIKDERTSESERSLKVAKNWNAQYTNSRHDDGLLLPSQRGGAKERGFCMTLRRNKEIHDKLDKP
jgi:hypothetical protein